MVGHTLSGVGVLDKAVLILDALADGERLSLGELTAATGLPRATAHRLAHALQVHRLAELGSDDRWSLGGRFAELAGGHGGARLADLARPALEGLRDTTGESVQLYVPRNGSRVCIVSLESPHSLRTIVPVGAELPLDRGSAGRILTGERGGRPRGWVQSVEEREKGVASVSAPVRRDGDVVAAVSVSGPVERTSRSPGRRYGDALVEAAARIEQAAGWA